MSIESGQNQSSRAHLGLGLAMILLAIARGWNDGLTLTRYLVRHGLKIVRAPTTVPWEEFSGVACMVWPVILGVVLLRSRSDRLLKAAVITGLALGLERVLSLTIGGVFDSGWRDLYRGSWDPTRSPVGPRGWLLLGSIASAVAWLALGAWAWRRAVAARAVNRAAFSPEERGRRREKPRVVNITAAVFAVAMVMMTSWGTYLIVLDRLPWIRNLVIGEQGRRPPPFVSLDTPQGRRFRDADRYFAEGQNFQASGRFLEARQSYVKATNRYEALMEDFPKVRPYRRQFAFAANNLAWFLVTCPEKAVREPESAVLLGRKAVAIDPNDGNALNTLAVAHFRAGELELAKAAFERSMALRGGGDSYDWFFLAQIDAVQGRPESAKATYDKAVVWMLDHRPRDPELFRFQIEAADRLKLPKPEMPAIDESKSPRDEGPIQFAPNLRRRLKVDG